MLASSRLSKRFFAGVFCVLLWGASSAVCAERNIEGTVLYKGGEPAADAAVELEDKATMQIVSRRTDRDGHFRFMGLSQDKDYGIRALKKGYWSKPHTVSRFSSRSMESVTLYLVPGHKN
jgi:hypothetical protein